eukprot:6476690-Amphidinium_carterae.1
MATAEMYEALLTGQRGKISATMEAHAPRMFAKLQELASTVNQKENGVPQQVVTETWFNENGTVKRSKTTKHYD